MNKNKLLFNIIIASSAVVFLLYIITLFADIFKTKNEINDINKKINDINIKIKQEMKNKKNISLADKDYLENAYFDIDGEYFESYIRTVFNKYNVKIKIYHSRLDRRDYSEISVSYKINAFDFFKLIKDIENGKRLVVIKDVSINRDDLPLFDVRMTLGAYYK